MDERAILEEILGRVAWNPQFKAQLLDDPSAALASIGIELEGATGLIIERGDCGGKTCLKTCKVTE